MRTFAAVRLTDLVSRARDGEREALAELYARHLNGVLQTAFRFVGSMPEAEDVAQELFIGLPEAFLFPTDIGGHSGGCIA